MTQDSVSYLLANQASELERLQLQSRVWEPAARELLNGIRSPAAGRVLDIGCGVMGWLRVLSEWIGPAGQVIGTDVDPKIISRAREFLDAEGLANVEVVADDLFQSQLPAASFDVVHSRFQIAPLGRALEQIAAYRRLLRPGGTLIVEDPDMSSWRVNPTGPAVQQLIALIERGFEAAGGNFNAGRELPALLRGLGLEPRVTARVVALEPGHPYLRLPLQFAASLRSRLEALSSSARLDELLAGAAEELSRGDTWGTTFTLIQCCVTEPRP